MELNIFVVEDEYWALEELKSILSKYESKHKFYFYENGEDAWLDLSIHHPRLVITDITMAVMDGLELIENVKKFDPSIKCILLTVHDTFEYARQSIKLGVVDYLLKPIKKQDLYSILDKTVEKIDEEKRAEAEKQLWSISQLIVNQLAVNTRDQELFDKKAFYMIGISFSSCSETFGNRECEFQLFLQKKGLVDESWLLSLEDQRKLLLIPYEIGNASFLEELYQWFKMIGQVHVGVVIKDETYSLIEAYQRLDHLMEEKMLFGESTFIQENEEYKAIDVGELWTSVRVIERQIRQGEFSSVSQQLDLIIEQIKQIKMRQKDLEQFLVNMYYAVLYKLQQNLKQVIRIDGINEKLKEIANIETYQQLRDWLAILMQLFMKAANMESIAPKHLIPKVKEWISEYYAENITFQEFADNHHVSLSYLSREFKEQTNMTFIDYLTNHRINKAKELFENGIDKTVEVGKMIGYNDPKHFRTVFKKITGLTPKEFRKTLT